MGWVWCLSRSAPQRFSRTCCCRLSVGCGVAFDFKECPRSVRATILYNLSLRRNPLCMNKLPRMDSNHDKVIQSRFVRLQKRPAYSPVLKGLIRAAFHTAAWLSMNESIDSLSMRRTPRCAPSCDLTHIAGWTLFKNASLLGNSPLNTRPLGRTLLFVVPFMSVLHHRWPKRHGARPLRTHCACYQNKDSWRLGIHRHVRNGKITRWLGCAETAARQGC